MNVIAQVSNAFRRKPVTTVALLIAVGVAFIVLREFAQGFLDGLIAGFTDGV
ncbi:hypothetical protein [Brevundimonas sp.]|uniref:hypothetical protein n=1 Tax=Brevundimonas sp. TaxID=1871086 RepID=UPI002CA1D150|nr:hypothetical protein [Brevundimonas sp.]HWQ88301.1 hypothetical protein [Brevundimonas sp.]